MGWFNRNQFLAPAPEFPEPEIREATAEEIRSEQLLEWDDLAAFLKAAGANRPVTDENVMGIPTVAGCIEFITGIAASVPIKLYRRGDKVTTVLDDPRLYLLNEDSGDLLTGPEWKKSFFKDYILRGRGWAYLNKFRNDIRSIHYVDDRTVSVSTNNHPIFKTAAVHVQGTCYMPHDFVRMARNTKDGVLGVGLIKQAQDLLSMALNYIDFENAVVRAGGGRRGFLQSERKLAPNELENLKTAFEKLYGTSYEGVVVLNNGVKFSPATATSVELQLAENKLKNREELCALIGVPVSIVNGTATPEDFARGIRVAVAPMLDHFVKAVDRAMLLESEKGQLFFGIDERDLQTESLLNRYKAYTEAVKAGWLSKNEIRYQEKYEAIEGLDVVSMSLGEVIFDVKTGRYYVPNTGQEMALKAAPGPGEPPDEGEDEKEENA